MLHLEKHALERLARDKRLRVLALEPLPVLEACGLVALRLEVSEQPPRAQQPDRCAAAFRVVSQELAQRLCGQVPRGGGGERLRRQRNWFGKNWKSGLCCGSRFIS